MVQFIDNLNILSTSTIYYTAPDSWEYNNNFVINKNTDDDLTKISMLNDQYSVKYYIDDSYSHTRNNAVVIQGMVVSVGNEKKLSKSIIDKQNCIYAAPKLENGIYVEQNPFSTITYEIDPNRANYARPVIDGAIYNTTWTKIANEPSGAYLYITPSISGNGIRNIYSSDVLESWAIYNYSEYPTFAQNLKNMSHGAARVTWGSLFYNYLGSQAYQGLNLFQGMTFLDSLWLMPFASDDEYNAAYAVLYKWPDYDIRVISNWRRS